MLAAWGHAMHTGLPALPDSHEYLSQGQNLLQHGSPYAQSWQVPYREEWLTRRPPLYGALLAGAMALLPGPAIIPAVLLLQVLVTWLCMAWACRCLASHGVDRRWWGVPAWLALATPAAWVYPVSIMTEPWLQGLLVLTVAGWLRGRQTGRTGGLWLAGGTLAAAVWLKPVMVGVGALALAAVIHAHERRPAAWLAACLPVVAVLTLMGCNARLTGVWHASSLPTYNLLHWNARLALLQEQPEAEVSAQIARIQSEADRTGSLGEALSWRREQATAILRRHPQGAVRQMLRGLGAFWLDPGRFDLAVLLGEANPPSQGLMQVSARSGVRGVLTALWTQSPGRLALLLLGLAANVLAVIGVALALLRHRANSPLVATAAMLMAYIWILTGPLGAARFRMPVLPLLAVVATLGWAHRRSVSSP
jgi:hypothetical protein